MRARNLPRRMPTRFSEQTARKSKAMALMASTPSGVSPASSISPGIVVMRKLTGRWNRPSFF